MKKTTILTSSLLAVALFSGCSTKYQTVTAPIVKNNGYKIKADQMSLVLFAKFRKDTIASKNFEYVFATAATKAKELGYKYFSITAPKNLMQVLINKKVNTPTEAQIACNDGGDGDWNSYFSYGHIWVDKDGLTAKDHGLGIGFNYGCNSAKHIWKDGMGSIFHVPITIYVSFHNENRKDNLTFSADEVLYSDFVKELNPKYFVDIEEER